MGQAWPRIKSSSATRMPGSVHVLQDYKIFGLDHHGDGRARRTIRCSKTPAPACFAMRRWAQQTRTGAAVERYIEAVQRQAETASYGLDVSLLACPAVEESFSAGVRRQRFIGADLHIRKEPAHERGLIAHAAPLLDVDANLDIRHPSNQTPTVGMRKVELDVG